MEEVEGVFLASWTFKFADTPPDESPTRKGFFAVFPSLDAYSQQSTTGQFILRMGTLQRIHPEGP